MDIWHIWIIIAIILFIIEIFTTGFAVICFSFGAIAAAIVSACGCSYQSQAIWFAIISIFALIVVRPILYKVFKKKFKDYRTNADAMIDMEVIVKETIDPNTGTGLVTVDGVDWKAVSEHNNIIEKGSKVKIININSIILTVKQ